MPMYRTKTPVSSVAGNSTGPSPNTGCNKMNGTINNVLVIPIAPVSTHVLSSVVQCLLYILKKIEKNDIVVGNTIANNSPRSTFFSPLSASPCVDVSSAPVTVPMLMSTTPTMHTTHATDFMRCAGIIFQHTPRRYTNPHWLCCIATLMLTGM